MISFTLVSGNAGKIAEWRRLLPLDVIMQIRALDLEEIQSYNSVEIVAHKLRAAYKIVGTPVVVEDVGAGLDNLKGLPGPFIKFFEQRLGDDALYILAGSIAAPATVRCTIGYYDGKRELIADGELHGNVVSARGEGGFGFDKVFMPDGLNKTFAQLKPDEKDAISHRSKALKELLNELKEL